MPVVETTRTKSRRRKRKFSTEVPQAPKPALQSEAAAERSVVLESFYRDQLKWKNVDWIVLVWMVGMHVGALAAPFFFTWSALGVTAVLHWLTCSIGICLCYHRCLSHRSLKLRQPSRFFALLAGVISGEGSPLMWAGVHRIHHARSDQDGDPHSPLEGTFWSHILWLFVLHDPKTRDMMNRRFCPDLAKDKLLVFFDRTYGMWIIGTGVVLYALGGLPWLLWGLCVRMVLAYHSTWFVNSATHLWGYRNYQTKDESRNLWWVALFAYGEGWHNNHHAHPRLARAGHRWWEVDMTWWSIRFLQLIGQATDVDDRIPVEGAESTEHDL
ncbi:MAG: fatty acid desaturase [Planctomyces sp.]|nr:fatty acid desaturase [Planctomyces sp.]